MSNDLGGKAMLKKHYKSLVALKEELETQEEEENKEVLRKLQALINYSFTRKGITSKRYAELFSLFVKIQEDSSTEKELKREIEQLYNSIFNKKKAKR